MSKVSILNNSLVTKKIYVLGMVQGVGYRPFAARLLEQMNLCGIVRNSAGIVILMVTGEKQAMDELIRRLKLFQPEGARVDEVLSETMPLTVYDGVRIVASSEDVRIAASDEGVRKSGNVKMPPLLPPDLPTCKRCERELLDPKNRRYRYPFISCVSCGPRYSIIRSLPYDRCNTTMDQFPLCEGCEKEYTGAGDIRRHAQTIACHSCGPVLKLTCAAVQDFVQGQKQNLSQVQSPNLTLNQDPKLDSNRNDPLNFYMNTSTWIGEDAFQRACKILETGGILAVKDIGGYHLCCSPQILETVRNLRSLKGREKKPFAVMFPDVSSICEYCELSEEEKRLLESNPRPIVLLYKKKDFVEGVCSDSSEIGAMLPCNPLQILLMKACGPLIMTSGNRSGESMIIEDAKILKWMMQNKKLSGVLWHEREILTPLDDSVVRSVCHRTQIIRRARGYVPEPIRIPEGECSTILATGGDLKACFCIKAGRRAYLSQYFGDLENAEVAKAYESTVRRMKTLFGLKPEKIICDLHPGYYSTEWAFEQELPTLKVQHHHAHIASVIAEHGLQGKVLGVAMDGTGYGTDGTIWGSEFLICEGASYERVASLEPVSIIGGDVGAKNAQTQAYSYLHHAGIERIELAPLQQSEYELVKRALDLGINRVTSTSAGRLFDAVSALLGVCKYNEYEGQCAIQLERSAQRAIDERAVDETVINERKEEQRADRFLLNLRDNLIGKNDSVQEMISLQFPLEFKNDRWYAKTDEVIKRIVEGLKEGRTVEELSLEFHIAFSTMIVELAKKIRQQCNVTQIALSGGTFQNRILLERTNQALLEEGFIVYVNEQVPCGDGGISLGQAYIGGFRTCV